MKAHPGGVTAVAFTPDGKRLVTSGASRPRQKYLDRRLGDVKLWDAATGQPLPFSLDGPDFKVETVALSPDGTHLAATCLNQTVSGMGTGHRRARLAGRARGKGRPRSEVQSRRQAAGLHLQPRGRRSDEGFAGFDPNLEPGQTPGHRGHRRARQGANIGAGLQP